VADNIISIGVTVETGPAQSNMAQLADFIHAAIAKMGAQVAAAAKAIETSMQTALKGVQDAVEGMSKGANDAGKSAHGMADAVGGALSTIPYLGAADAVIKLGVAIKDQVDATKDEIIGYEKAAQAAGISVEKYVELKDALQAAQIPTEHLPELLGTLSSKINEAAHGSVDAQQAFHGLGIATDSWKNHIPSTHEVFLQLVDAIKNSKNPMAALDIAHQVLGARYKELAPLMNLGSSAIREQEAAHHDNAVAVGGASKSVHELQRVEDLFSERLQTALLPLFPVLVEAVKTLVSYFIIWKTTWETVVRTIMLNISGLVDAFKGLSAVMKDVFAGHWGAAADDAKAALAKIKSDAIDTAGKVLNAWEKVPEDLKKIWADVPKTVGKGNGGLTSTLGKGSKERTAIVELENHANVISHRAADEQIVSDANTILGQLPGVQQTVDNKMLGILTQYTANVKVVSSKSNNDIEQGEKQSLERRRQQWGQVFQGISGAFSSFTQSLLNGHQTLSQAWSKLVDDMANKFLAGLQKQLMDFLQHKLMEITIHESAEKTKDAASEASHATEDKRTAFSAAKAAFESVVHTPIVGPILAPLAAAAAFAAVATFGSAEGGQYLVPGPQLTMLHAQEMVLPASLAGRMRNVIDNGAGGGGGGSVQIHFHVNAIDGQDAANFIGKNSRNIAGAVAKELKKKGFFPK
jgi:hypothetical protein